MHSKAAMTEMRARYLLENGARSTTRMLVAVHCRQQGLARQLVRFTHIPASFALKNSSRGFLQAFKTTRKQCSFRRSILSGSSRADAASTKDKDYVNKSVQTQQNTTQLLAKLVDAGDPAAVARENVASLTQEFFMISSTFLSMAQKEGNKEMATRLESVLGIAWQEKQRTMRPELRLLNQLCAVRTVQELREAVGKAEAREALTMNDRYFFQILERMTADVGKQPITPDRTKLLKQLQDIKREALIVSPAPLSSN